MKLTITQQDMLKRFKIGSLNTTAFTTSSRSDGLNAKTVEMNLTALEEYGLIQKSRTGHKITAKGRDWLDGPGKSVEPARITNASVRGEPYEGTVWNPVRPGADDHKKYHSRGGFL